VSDAPGAYLFAFAVLVGAVAWLVLRFAGRTPFLAVVTGPIVASWVIVTEESPPTRHDQIAIVTIASAGAIAVVLSLSYALWLVRLLRDIRTEL
jgi:hypothetical protein